MPIYQRFNVESIGNLLRHCFLLQSFVFILIIIVIDAWPMERSDSTWSIISFSWNSESATICVTPTLLKLLTVCNSLRIECAMGAMFQCPFPVLSPPVLRRMCHVRCHMSHTWPCMQADWNCVSCLRDDVRNPRVWPSRQLQCHSPAVLRKPRSAALPALSIVWGTERVSVSIATWKYAILDIHKTHSCLSRLETARDPCQSLSTRGRQGEGLRARLQTTDWHWPPLISSGGQQMCWWYI